MTGPIAQHLCIWPESECLKSSLNSERLVYTMPSIKFADILPDKVATTILNLSGKVSERPAITAEFFSLKILVDRGLLRAALNLTTKLLTDLGQGVGMTAQPFKNTIESFEIWSVRFQLFMALKMYTNLVEELAPFNELDAPDTYLQFYREYEPLEGSIVPFALRLIHAEVLIHTTESGKAFNRVQRLEDNTKKAVAIAQQMNLDEIQLNIWHRRLETVQLLKARIFYKLRRYERVFSIYETLFNASTDDRKRFRLLTSLIQIAMSVGNSKRLNQYIELLAHQTGVPDCERSLFECLKAIFYGMYGQALEVIQNSPKHEFKFCNNQAICLLYNGKVEESMNLLSQHNGQLVEPIAINLATISDLAITTNSELLLQYFLSHCDNVCDFFDPQLLKLE